MKKLALAIGLSLTSIISAFNHEDSWELVIEQENITAAAVVVNDFYANNSVYYYAVKDKGIFITDSLGTRLLNGETTGDQPVALLSTSEMLLTNQDRTLYAAASNKLFTFNVGGEAPHEWTEIETQTEIETVAMVSCNDSVFILTEDKKLYTIQDQTVSEITIPEGVVTGFDIVTPIRIGKEALFTNNLPQGAPWLLLECSNGFIKKHIILSLPIEGSTPVTLGNSVKESSEVLYGVTEDYTPIQAISNGNKVTLEAYNEFMPTEGIRDLIFPNGTVITDMHAINRDFPVWHAPRIEMYTPVILFISTTIGSYSFGLRELMESDEPLYITDDIDPYLTLYDSIPSKKIINRDILSHYEKYQFVINNKGISQYQAPYNDAIISDHNASQNKKLTIVRADKLTISLPGKSSGTLKLMNLQGQVLKSVYFNSAQDISLEGHNKIAKGIYFLDIKTHNKGDLTQKIRL